MARDQQRGVRPAVLVDRGTVDRRSALFEVRPEVSRIRRAPYADLTGGITFALREPQSVLARWQRQIAAMRKEVRAG